MELPMDGMEVGVNVMVGPEIEKSPPWEYTRPFTTSSTEVRGLGVLGSVKVGLVPLTVPVGVTQSTNVGCPPPGALNVGGVVVVSMVRVESI